MSVLPIKAWWRSRTFWVNILALIAFIINHFVGYQLPAEIITMILAVLNIILRFDTTTPIG